MFIIKRVFIVSAVIVVLLSTAALYANDELQYVLIEIDHHDQVYELGDYGVNIENVRGLQVWARVTEAQRQQLLSKGYKITSLEHELREAEARFREMLMDDLGVYHTYAEQTGYLHMIASTYPDIAVLDSIGPSIEGRWIWALKLTDNPLLDEDEPEFCYFSTMHGNEPPGTEMCLNLIDLLVTGYDTSATAANIINNYELWILPMLNPDGYVHNQRYNMSMIDLNRNYPVPDGDIGDDGTYDIEPENQAVIDFCNGRYFVVAANYHTGALVTNYPWDYTSTRSPEDALLIEMSLDYSYRNPPMWNSLYFYHGITNGYDWYEVNGSLQDWAHYERSQLHLTIEINDVKWPAESVLDDLWDDNREAMLHTITWADRGVRGIVTDSITGLPLGATVDVLGTPMAFFCDPSVGDYHRPLLPDTYSIEYSCPGYHSKTISEVVVGSGSATRLDVQLRPYGTSTITGYALLADELNHNGILVNAEFDTFIYSDTTDASGYYNITSLLPSADYLVTASKPGWKDSSVTWDLAEGTFDTINFMLYPYDTLYFSDFEDDSGTFYAYGPRNDWEYGIPTTGPGNAYSGEKLWATKLNSNYRDTSQSHLALEVDLRTLDAATLYFMSWYSFQAPNFYGYHDGGNLKISIGGGPATLMSPAGGYDATLSEYNWLIPEEQAFADDDLGDFWHQEEVDLTPYCGNYVTLFFEFGSSSVNSEAGWYIDDVLISYVDYTLVVDSENSARVPGNFILQPNFPNPFNASTKINFNLNKECLTNISIYDILGTVVWESRENTLSPGKHSVVWAAEDTYGNALPTGIYMCVFRTDDDVSQTIKMLLVR